MALRFLLKIWLFYLALKLYRHFCVLCCLLGFRVLRLCVPFLISRPYRLEYERLLELREEVLDMDRQERQLEAELASMPEDPSGSESPESEDHDSFNESDSYL